MRILIILLCLSITSLCYAEKYAIKKIDGKLSSYQKLSDEYIASHKDDPSNPLNSGYELVDSISTMEKYVSPKKPTTEERLDALEKKVA